MGGAAGHMNHPFDLNWVTNGADLIDFFERAKAFIEDKGAGAVKIDGVNVSFKVVETERGHEFAVDRGSLKNIDIEGITMDRVDDRFPEGHGMRPAIRALLTILNTALPSVENELMDLGMWDNPSLFLNTEYVEGTTNVTEYDENFLAIHGLNQFYEKTAKSGASKGNMRPGAERPEGVKSPSVEMPYNPETMQELIDKLNPVANEHGFQVYGSVPTEKISDVEVNYASALSEPFTVKLADDREITKSLGEWLSEAENPRYKAVKLKNGKRTHSLHKELYKAVLSGAVPLVDIVEDSDVEAVIYGAVIMHATRVLGNSILSALTSPMGDVTSHEGIVLRDEKTFGPNPVKITGDFIVGGMGSAFQADTSLNEDEEIEIEVEDEDDDPVIDSDFGKTVAIVPGAFKPPHNGHLAMVRAYADVADEVIVLISRPMKSSRSLPSGREITAEDSLEIWELLVDSLPNVRVQISDHASPLTAAYEYVGRDGPLEAGTKVILGASMKEDDWKRWTGAEKYIKKGVTLLDPKSTSVLPSTRANGEPFSSTAMRDLLGRVEEDPDVVEELEEFIGEENIFDLLAILGIGAPMKEMSAASGGMQGAIGPIKKKKVMRRENINIDTVDEVMRLIMERGILQ
jgi:cytidyltransferase-like protein|tara:strand:- start:1636 stop:3528 length:1893 start_codon:yes stop_codon:yes gene_type:complete